MSSATTRPRLRPAGLLRTRTRVESRLGADGGEGGGLSPAVVAVPATALWLVSLTLWLLP
jgi:hypothetical protein